MAAVVHPYAPRFAQAITGVLCLEALIFQTPGVVAVALVLVVLGLAGHPWSPVGWLFRLIAPPPRELEPQAPVRFSQVLAVIFLGLATGAFALGFTLVGWILAGIVASLALLSAIFGLCVGCEIYRFVLARRTADGESAGDLLGLEGSGPWLVVLTAPGCARCGPVADAVSAKAAPGDVRVVDLSERPSAAGLPVKSVPAVLAIDRAGAIVAARAGRLAESDIDEVLAAV